MVALQNVGDKEEHIYFITEILWTDIIDSSPTAHLLLEMLLLIVLISASTLTEASVLG